MSEKKTDFDSDSAAIVLVFKAGAFRYWWAITYRLVVAQPISAQH